MSITGLAGGLFRRAIKRFYGFQNEVREAIINFNHDIEKPSQIEVQHRDLYREVDDFLANNEMDEDWPDWEMVNTFLGKYKDLTDTSSMAQKVRELIEAKAGWSGPGYDAEVAAYYPEEYGKAIPSRGKWIMPIREIPVEEKFRPGLYNAYYAKPYYTPVEFAIGEHKKTVIRMRRLKARINVEAGEVMLLPHEYVVIDDTTSILQGVGEAKEYEMVRLGGTPDYDRAKVHYLGTRGVPAAQVYEMLLGDINTTNYCYFRLKPEFFEQYDYIISAMQKGIRYEMACKLWYHAKTGIPMFKVNIVKDATTKAKPGKSRKKTDSA